MKARWLVLPLLALVMTSCKKSSDDPALQPPAAQIKPPPPPAASLTLDIYTDDLHKGGAFEYPSDGSQDLAFKEAVDPAVGSYCMRYGWSGGDTNPPRVQHIFVGVDLIHVGDLSTYASTPGVDLRSKNFTRVTFHARGSLGSNVVLKIEVSDDGSLGTRPPCIVLSTSGTDNDATPGNSANPCTNLATLKSTWQSYSLPVTSTDLAAVKDYFKATYIYKLSPATMGTGGTVFFDQIQYQP